MELGTTLSLIKKYGVNALMALALVWMNNRLNRFEDRLYDCYDDKEKLYFRSNDISNSKHEDKATKTVLVAVLPNTNTNTKRKYDRAN